MRAALLQASDQRHHRARRSAPEQAEGQANLRRSCEQAGLTRPIEHAQRDDPESLIEHRHRAEDRQRTSALHPARRDRHRTLAGWNEPTQRSRAHAKRRQRPTRGEQHRSDGR
jgi:hypothetical protein